MCNNFRAWHQKFPSFAMASAAPVSSKCNWDLDETKLSPNQVQTKYMITSYLHKWKTLNISVSTHNKCGLDIKCVKGTQALGETVDENISWNEQ